MQGLEFSSQLSLSEQFSIGLSGHYIETEFVKISDATSPFALGDPVNYTPKYSVSLNTKFTFEGPMGAEGVALLDYNQQGGSSAIRSQTIRGESETLGQLSAQIGLDWDSFSTRLFGRNLTDERDFTFFPLVSFAQPRPRTWGIDFTYRF